jgi:hypothetical protein
LKRSGEACRGRTCITQVIAGSSSILHGILMHKIEIVLVKKGCHRGRLHPGSHQHVLRVEEHALSILPAPFIHVQSLVRELLCSAQLLFENTQDTAIACLPQAFRKVLVVKILLPQIRQKFVRLPQLHASSCYKFSHYAFFQVNFSSERLLA